MMREKTNKIYRSGIVHTDTAEQILDIFRTHLLNHPPRYFGDIDSIAEFLYFQYTKQTSWRTKQSGSHTQLLWMS